MREFILLALKARTTPDIALNNLPDSGRMDLVCRFISSCLCVSNGVRDDTIVHVSLNGPLEPPKLVTIYGDKIKGLKPDERTIALFLIEALKQGLNLKLNQTKPVFEGIEVSKKSFETLIKEKQNSQLIYLHKKGKDITQFEFKENPVFVIGDYSGIPNKTEKFLDSFEAERVSLGPKILLASHCPVIIHNELDRHLQTF